MNVNLNIQDSPNPTIQDEIDEHSDIMAGAGHKLTGETMLLSDPEYPGAYRTWLRVIPEGDDHALDSKPCWVWVTPDGVVFTSSMPWAVTD